MFPKTMMPLPAVALCLAEIVAASAARAGATVETRGACFVAPPKGAPPLETDCGHVVVPKNPGRPDGAAVKLGSPRLASHSSVRTIR